jgi:putative MATE family efflux protein
MPEDPCPGPDCIGVGETSSEESTLVLPEGDTSGAAVSRRRAAVDLTQGSLLRGIVMLSWPIVTGAILNWVMGVADIKMVGALGPTAIAAVGQSQGVIWTVMAIIFAIATGTQVLVARYTGAGQHDRVAEVTRQSIILCVLSGFVMIPLGLLLARPGLALLGVSGSVLHDGTVYMQAFFWGSVFLTLNFIIASALQGAGDSLTPLLLLVWINLAHIGIEYVLIFGAGPIRPMGVAGAAWAVVISRGLASLFMLWIVTSGRFAITVPLHHSWRIDWSVWSKMFYIGIPSSLQGLTRNIAYLMLAFVLNHTDAGMYAISGHTVAGQWGAVGIFIGLAMMTAAMTAVGQNMGAENPERAERSCWQVVRISSNLSCVMGALCILFARPLVSFFTQDPQAIYWATWAMILLSFSLPFATVSMAFSGALRGAGDTMSPMWATLICSLGIGPGLAYLLAITCHLGPVGAWIGLATSMVAQALVTGYIFKRGKWKTIEL